MPSPHGRVDPRARTTRLSARVLGIAVVSVGSLVIVFGFFLIVSWLFQAPQVLAGTLRSGQDQAVGSGDRTTTTTTRGEPISVSAPTTITTPAAAGGPPPAEPRYLVPDWEAEPDAKQLAVDIALLLTTYEAGDVYSDHVRSLVRPAHLNALLNASRPLARAGHWSRGEVIYPQLGGLRNNKTSVMVMTRQTIGVGSVAELSLVRTLDIRLVKGQNGWEFDHLSSAGGQFDNVADLNLAHAVANDPRIEMPDSARLDILNGDVSPILLQVMAELADVTHYGVVVLVTGHPWHVFETNRVSHHTLGRAFDIYRVGDVKVIDDRANDSATRALVEWLFAHRLVHQVGSPWDLDGPSSTRSFTDAVHQDHIHVAVPSSR